METLQLSSPFVEAAFQGALTGCALIPLTLGLWLIYATTREFHVGVVGVSVAATAALVRTGNAPTPVRVTVALLCAIAAALAWQAIAGSYRRRGAGEARQVLASIAFMALAVNAAIAIAGTESAFFSFEGVGRHIRALLGVASIGIPAALLHLGNHGVVTRALIENPELAIQLGANRNRQFLTVGVAGLLFGVAPLLDAMDGTIGASTRGILIAALHATVVVALARALRGWMAYPTAAMMSIALGALSGIAGFFLPSGERLLPAAILLLWILAASRAWSLDGSQGPGFSETSTPPRIAH